MLTNDQKQSATAAAPPPLKKATTPSPKGNTSLYCQWVEIRALIQILESAWGDGDEPAPEVIEATPTMLGRLRREIEAMEC